MITIIKIHDKQWFKEHCRVRGATEYCSYLEPKSIPWGRISTVSWSLDGDMGQLVGKILEVEYDSGNDSGSIEDARYLVKSYWIPNWAIEWVKEEPDDTSD